ncbi:hypothetical protein Q3G72_014947 [Acer saccharum]|nr:hypothetical protein Q3G72_014947 [Acer saccharum]
MFFVTYNCFDLVFFLSIVCIESYANSQVLLVVLCHSDIFCLQLIIKEYNSEADAQANRGVYLRDGQVEKEYTYSNDSEYGIYSGYDSSESE